MVKIQGDFKHSIKMPGEEKMQATTIIFLKVGKVILTFRTTVIV